MAFPTEALLNNPIDSWSVSAILCLTIVAALRTIYLLYFHPLAKYPGPLLAKLSDSYAAYHAYKGDLHLKMKEMHDIYGDYVRFGPSRLMCNTDTALQTIYKTDKVSKARTYANTKSAFGSFNILNAVDKSIHSQRSRVMRQGLMQRAVRRYEPIWIDQAKILIDILMSDAGNDSKSAWTAPKDMTLLVNRLTIDIMGLVGFGKDLNLQTSSENRYMLDVLYSLQTWNSVNIQSSGLSMLSLDKFFYPQQFYYGRKVLQQIGDVIKKIESDPSYADQSFISILSKVRDSRTNKLPTFDELLAEGKFLMVALSDAVATTVASTLFYLSRNRPVYDKLVAEIRGTFQDPKDITSGPQMSSCHYLHACIRESLRMSPPSASAPWREVTADHLVIDDIVIPNGIEVGTCAYAIQHNEAYFPDSYAYYPERWLQDPNNPEESKLATMNAWSPFSLGTRGCTGRSMAEIEVADVIALLVWHLDMRIPSDAALASRGAGKVGMADGRHRPEEFQLEDHITSVTEGPVLQFRRRVC